jgi:uncharacterized membrane protein YphA (DoxX/SURF4 family)
MTKMANALLRLIVGGVFVFAGVVKIWNVEIKSAHEDERIAWTVKASRVPDSAGFAKDIENYRVPPRQLTNLVAITFPWIEVAAGLLLIFGIWSRASALVIGVMLIVFLLAIGQAVTRGLNISCGCFGTVEGRKVGLIALAQDVALLAMCAWLWWRQKESTQ